MVKRYSGGLISSSISLPSASSASGFWNPSEMTQAIRRNDWPLANLPSFDIIVVGGGGAAGRRPTTAYYGGAGGGAGRLIQDTTIPGLPGTYVVTVGAGGTATASLASSGNPTSVVNSTVMNFIAPGGGAGGLGSTDLSTAFWPGQPGGNGGGGAVTAAGSPGQTNAGGTTIAATTTGRRASVDYGFAGGAGTGQASTNAGGAGGGGGAGATGSSGLTTAGGIGRACLGLTFTGTVTTTAGTSQFTLASLSSGYLRVGSVISSTYLNGTVIYQQSGTAGMTGVYFLNVNATGTATGIAASLSGTGTIYAGGGAGAGKSGGTGIRTRGIGGLGGGGGDYLGVSVEAGSTNTGGGGAATTTAGVTQTVVAGGAGGSGIVVLIYPDTFPACTTTGTVRSTVAGGSRIYEFLSSGSFTFVT
jgi:hypothetical protein